MDIAWDFSCLGVNFSRDRKRFLVNPLIFLLLVVDEGIIMWKSGIEIECYDSVLNVGDEFFLDWIRNEICCWNSLQLMSSCKRKRGNGKLEMLWIQISGIIHLVIFLSRCSSFSFRILNFVIVSKNYEDI